MKINLNRNWDGFVKKAFDKILNKNINNEDDSITYVFHYFGDSIDIAFARVMKNAYIDEISTITIEKDQYYEGDKDDDVIIEDSIKYISPKR